MFREDQELLSKQERCIGCGNVIFYDKFGKLKQRNFCWPIDSSAPGFRWSKDIAGYCNTLGRHTYKYETSWLEMVTS